MYAIRSYYERQLSQAVTRSVRNFLDVSELGKPLGGGHPLGAVVTTPEIAASFANGMEFFSTFGGSTAGPPISSSIASASLR